ncbi:MAG: hypothetical protein MUO54_00755 [Anaerolineales bacterium]|nr:hypothetical protein [Anaerolineales bacterium]
MKDNRKILILVVGVFLIFIVAAIFVVGKLGSTGEQLTSGAVTEVSSVEPVDSGNSSTSEVSSNEATTEATGPSQETEAAVPTARTGLESTDPASVNLTSGNIQLVEVFAFW